MKLSGVSPESRLSQDFTMLSIQFFQYFFRQIQLPSFQDLLITSEQMFFNKVLKYLKTIKIMIGIELYQLKIYQHQTFVNLTVGSLSLIPISRCRQKYFSGDAKSYMQRYLPMRFEYLTSPFGSGIVTVLFDRIDPETLNAFLAMIGSQTIETDPLQDLRASKVSYFFDNINKGMLPLGDVVHLNKT